MLFCPWPFWLWTIAGSRSGWLDNDGQRRSERFPCWWWRFWYTIGSCGMSFPFFTPTSCPYLSLFFLSLLFLNVLLVFFWHLLLPMCWVRPAGPAVPTLISLTLRCTRGNVWLSQYCSILSYPLKDCLVHQLQLSSTDIHPFVFAIEVLGYTVS